MAKIQDVAKLFIHFSNELENNQNIKSFSMTQLRLQKLLYLAQGFYLGKHNKELFSDNLIAWKYGPVSVAIYRKYLKYGSDKICEDESFDVNKCFNNEEIDFLYKFFIQYVTTATSKLVTIAHAPNSPWNNTNQGGEIDKTEMQCYFKKQKLETFNNTNGYVCDYVPERTIDGIMIWPIEDDEDDEWYDDQDNGMDTVES